MPYTPERPRLSESSEELRARIPGWGVDLDPADRPSVPRERLDPALSSDQQGAPEQQPERWPRERSIEHSRLTPVFGTATPPRGISGLLRKVAYRRYSEARAAHWLILLAADRVDTLENVLRAAATGRPDNPVTESGVLSEPGHHPISSRLGQGRADLQHQWLDPVIVAGPWVAAGFLAYRAARRLTDRRRDRERRASASGGGRTR